MDPVPPAPPPSPTPAPIPQPVVPPPETKSKVWLWILGGISLLGTGIVAGVLLGKQLYSQPASQPTPSPVVELTPTPDPTANWKTYTNTKYNYSFKYPNGWEFDRGQANSSDEELPLTTDISLYDKLYDATPSAGFIVHIAQRSSVSFVQSCNEIESCAKKAMSYYSYPKTVSPTYTYTQHQFLGIRATEVTYDLPDLYNSNKTTHFSRNFFLKDGDLYEITTYIESNQYAKFKQIFDQILSTFKFVD